MLKTEFDVRNLRLPVYSLATECDSAAPQNVESYSSSDEADRRTVVLTTLDAELQREMLDEGCRLGCRSTTAAKHEWGERPLLHL